MLICTAVVSFFIGTFVGVFLAALMHSASTYSREGEDQ